MTTAERSKTIVIFLNGRSVMMLESTDFEAAFQARDAMKRKDGLDICRAEFESLHKSNPDHLPYALNYGICLLETGDFKGAEFVLGHICGVKGRTDISRHWLFESVKFYTLSIKSRSKIASIDAVLERLDSFERDYQARLISHIITHLADHTTLDHVMLAIKKMGSNFQLNGPALRKFYEMCSSVDALDRYKKICSSFEEINHDDERQIIKLLHHDFYGLATRTSDQEWAEIYYKLKGSGARYAPFDAYRLSLQLHQRLGAERAEQEIKDFIDLGDEYFSCFWPLGALLESEGDEVSAVKAYSSAGIREIKRDKQSCSTVSVRSKSEVKISCIAISFNDAPLVNFYCEMVRPHCDEIIVNDGGSTDSTIENFMKFSHDTGFPVRIIRDQQASFRDRNVFNKDGYRRAGLGGVKGFEADRRRTTTLLLAQYEYILLADLDDFFPPYPNMKTIVAANYGVEHIAGSKRELINQRQYCDLYQSKKSAMPTLFKRNRNDVFSGISGDDEYLARLDQDLSLWATNFMKTSLSRAYHFWHLKWLLDPSQKAAAQGGLGVKSSVMGIYQRPEVEKILADISMFK